MWQVTRFVRTPYRNVNFIFPTKQRDVEILLDSLLSTFGDMIERVTVFGSSVTSACNPWSDIDICVEGILERPKFPKLENTTDVDFICGDDLAMSDSICREVRERGVVVYERERNR